MPDRKERFKIVEILRSFPDRNSPSPEVVADFHDGVKHALCDEGFQVSTPYYKDSFLKTSIFPAYRNSQDCA